MNKLSAQAKLHHETLDKLLSEDGGSEIYSLVALLDALGFKLAIAYGTSVADRTQVD